jgi:hypothetical protein
VKTDVNDISEPCCTLTNAFAQQHNFRGGMSIPFFLCGSCGYAMQSSTLITRSNSSSSTWFFSSTMSPSQQAWLPVLAPGSTVTTLTAFSALTLAMNSGASGLPSLMESESDSSMVLLFYTAFLRNMFCGASVLPF